WRRRPGFSANTLRRGRRSTPNDPQGRPQARQGERRQDRRSPLHRPARTVAALLDSGIRAERGHLRGWPRLRWLLDPRRQTIDESDMLLIPDPTTAVMDPFTAVPTLVLICNVKDPVTGKPYTRDPRYIAQKAEAYVKKTGVTDTIYIGPELEFF